MQLATARKSGVARSLLTIDQRGYEMLVIPIEAPGLRAWLVAGFELDQELANIITRLSGSSVIFRASPNGPGGFINFATSSDIDSTEDPALNGTESNQNFIKSDRYFTRILDLGGFGQISFEAVLLTSREASRQNYYSRALEIALLVTVIMALAILLALLTARHLGRPVLQLADYARAVGHGDNPPAPDIRTGGELRQLRDTLRDTLARLIRREGEIRNAATHDEVTGLGNRNALMQSAKDSFDAGKPCSLIGLRVSDLSDINDTLGLAFGDKVLLGLSQRLRDELPDAGIIARTGGGEFLTLIPQLGPEALALRAQALHDTVVAPRNIENTPFSLRTHLITLQLPADASNNSELRRRVNLTFEHAFRQGVAVTRYERGRDEDHLRELKLVSDLHSAVRNNGLHMNYQPKLDNSTGQLLQVEALVRWIHPELGFISPEEAMATLNRLRNLGVTLSIDDFGTGYSSLSQLRKLPVQELKIDKSFVLKLNAEPQDPLIVKSTIDMAHGLGLKVVAEGIENLETWKLLQAWGCDVGQGFYLSRPVSADKLAQTVAALAERQQELSGITPEHSP